jgi:hypothetical protein
MSLTQVCSSLEFLISVNDTIYLLTPQTITKLGGLTSLKLRKSQACPLPLLSSGTIQCYTIIISRLDSPAPFVLPLPLSTKLLE